MVITTDHLNTEQCQIPIPKIGKHFGDGYTTTIDPGFTLFITFNILS